MAVLCMCEAFGLWVAPFISDNIHLKCKRFRIVIYLFQSVSFGSSDFSSWNEGFPHNALRRRHTYKRA